jgi:hypothetical protein
MIEIHCVICLNRGKRTAAVVVPGAKYQGCAEHRELVDTPGFDALSLRLGSRAF